MSKDKKYGLIMPDKTKMQQPVFQASRNVFGNDSDSEDDTNKKRLFLTRPSDITNRQAKISQQKALQEDPTVYQYDEVYDSMTSKEEKKVKPKEEKKPRYIENLMKAASKRKIENERRLERQVQKEREAEGDEFADKEVFVTSAYKKKLQEMRLEEEKEKREEYLESIGDVTKQKDLGGFYRHLYEQKLGKDKNLEEQDTSTETPNVPKDNLNKDEGQVVSKSETSKKRNYRKRKSSDTGKQLSDGEIEDSEEEINRMNLKDIRDAKKSKQLKEDIDADSDFMDESSDEDTVKESNNKQDEPDQPTETLTKADDKTVTNIKIVTKEANSKDNLEKVKIIEPKKPKVDIWKKRTVGEVFEQALQRYYQRKAARGI